MAETRSDSYFAFPPAPGQIPALDGLRALAVALVMARHGLLAEGSPPRAAIGGWDAVSVLVNGWVGVDLFFVLSGYLIASGLLKSGAPGYGVYLVNRALRILPAYYAVLLIVAFGLVPFYPISDEAWGLRLGYHLVFLQDYLPANFVVAFWSLGVEEKFYLLAPLIVLPLFGNGRARRGLLVLAGLILLAPAARLVAELSNPGISDYPDFFYAFRSPFHASMDALLIGVAVAACRHDATIGRALAPWAGRIFWAGAAGLLVLIGRDEMLARITLYDKLAQSSLIALAGGAMVLGAALDGGPRRVLGATALRVTARLSYALYLVHLVVIPAALALLPAGATGGARIAAFFGLYLGLSLLAALALHYGIEKPGLVLKARLARRRGPARAAGLSPPLPAAG